MSKILYKQVIHTLKTHSVYIPLFKDPVILPNFQSIYSILSINNPVYTYNDKYYFISELGVYKTQSNFNEIASMIRKNDMYGDIIIQPKNFMIIDYTKFPPLESNFLPNDIIISKHNSNY